jgi:membrane protease YdiL (CAAX protease family)
MAQLQLPEKPVQHHPPANLNPQRWAALTFAMLLPTGITLLHLIILAGSGTANAGQQAAYIGGTVLQFVLPLGCFWYFERRLPKPGKPSFLGLEYGLLFGVAVAAAMLTLYYAWLCDTPLFGRTAEQVRSKLGEFGITSPLAFVLFAVFLTVVHSLLEEYYWRWFVFGGLRRLVPVWPAIVVSGVAFSLHHVVLMWVWFPDQVLLAVIPFSVAVAVGGMVWAWLYERTGSIYAAWLSHLLVDGAIFVIAYDLYFVRG